MDIVLEDYLNSICCGEIVEPLNRIEFTTGNAPTIEDLETILGFTLLNPVKTGDVITFDNVDYHIPDSAFIGNENIISFDVASGVTAGNFCFAECFSLTTGFDNLINAGDYCFAGCTSLTANFNNLITAGENCFLSNIALTTGFDNLTSAGQSCFEKCTSLTANFNNLITAGPLCFTQCTSLTGGFSSLVNVPYYCFNGCTGLTNLNFINVDTFGSDVVDEEALIGITGNTITVTAKTIHQTSNGGSLEGDLQYLSDNNTVTFIWV